MSFQAYLFDLDGTLIDSVRLILDSFHHTRRVHFGDQIEESVYIESMGTPLRTVFARMTQDPQLVDAMVTTYRAMNHAEHDAHVRAYEGVPELLEQLRSRGARIAVVTSKLRELAWRGLRVCGLDAHVELVIGADDVQRAKPDPEPVHLALRSLQIDPNDAVFIGDSPHDIHAGNAAKVITGAASWGPFTRDALAAAEPKHWLAHPLHVLSLTR